jgi:phosphohistidine phosphatase
MLKMILMRHGEATNKTQTDKTRPLTQHGENQSLQAGKKIATMVPSIDCCLVSDAIRTTQTALHVLKSIQAKHITYDPLLYTASQSDEFQSIVTRSLNAADGTILIIGHNPIISMEASRLSGHPIQFTTGEFITLGHPLMNWDEALKLSGCWNICH